MTYNYTKDKPSKIATRLGKDIDKDLLYECLLIQSNSKDETRMVEFITDKLTEWNIHYEIDEVGNILATKGHAELYPTLACHMDTVHDLVEKFLIFENEDIIFAMDGKDTSQTGIGGDDKVGVFIALSCIKDMDICKAVFFTREEIGCYGSGRVSNDWFSNSSFIAQVDRKGATDFVTTATGTVLCSTDFKTAVSPYLTKWGYTDYTNGGLTDVVTLVENSVGTSCFNMSCGYYDPHSDNETIKISDVQATWGIIWDLFHNLNHKRWTHVTVKKQYTPAKTTTSYVETQVDKYYEITDESYEFIEKQQAKTGSNWWSLPIHKCQACGEGLYSDETGEDNWWCFACNDYKIVGGTKI